MLDKLRAYTARGIRQTQPRVRITIDVFTAANNRAVDLIPGPAWHWLMWPDNDDPNYYAITGPIVDFDT